MFDANEAESWMSEQELYMMTSTKDRARDEFAARNLLKKHDSMEKTVEDYADTVRSLAERSRKLIEENHPDRLSSIDEIF